MRSVSFRIFGVLPVLFALLFMLAPLMVVALVSLTSSDSFEASLTGTGFASRLFPTIASYKAVVSDPLYVRAAISSIGISTVSALMAVLVAYPLAYVISQCRDPARGILAAAVLLPFWTSFLLRIYAWSILLSANGPLNQIATRTGITAEPFHLLHTNAAACVGIAYSYLPFAFLPIFASLVGIDRRYFEAAADLGAGQLACLFRIVLPLSLRGIQSGFLLVFIPALGEFVVPELLGGPNTLTFGRSLWMEFFANRDWPTASALGMSLLVLVGFGAILVARNKPALGRL